MLPDLEALRLAAEDCAKAEADLAQMERAMPGSMAHRRADDTAHSARLKLTLTPNQAIAIVDEIEKLRADLDWAQNSR